MRGRWADPRSLGVGLVAVVVIVVGVWVALGGMAVPAPPEYKPSARQWFYDMNTKELFASARGQVPPIAAPSGPGENGGDAGVLAHVYACGPCDGTGGPGESGADRQLVYLESFKPDARRELVRMKEAYLEEHGIDPAIDMLLEMAPQLHSQRLAMRPGQGPWVTWPEAAGDVSTALNLLAQKCREGGGSLRACFPPDR